MNILILFFFILITYQLVIAYSNNFKEGLTSSGSGSSDTASDNGDSATYSDYSPEETLSLAKKNAGNIIYLQEQVGGIGNLKQEVVDLSNNVSELQEQLKSLADANSSYATQLVGSSTPTITGT